MRDSRMSTLPAAAVRLEAAVRAAPDRVHPQHPGAAPSAGDGVLFGARALSGSGGRPFGESLLGLAHGRDYTARRLGKRRQAGAVNGLAV